MTLRRCNFELEQYSEQDHPKGVTTEITNKGSTLKLGDYFSFC